MLDSMRKYLNEDQDPGAVEKIYTRVVDLLTSGEEMLYIGVQRKPAINISPDGIVLTNKRVIFCRPRNLGLSMDFADYHWKDIKDCHMKEGILGADFTLLTVQGQHDAIDYLPKAQARKLYQLAQEMEERKEEWRRERELEEKRAAAGNVVVGGSPVTPTSPTPGGDKAEDPVAVLQKLKTMLDHGLISQHEYEAKKAEILNRM